MISMRKQIFSIMLFVGGFIILFTGLFINITVKNRLSDYVEGNLHEITYSIEEIYSNVYNQPDWREKIDNKVQAEPFIEQCTLSILNTDKKLLWRHISTEVPNQKQYKRYSYLSYESPLYSKDKKLIGYLNIEYMPSMFLSKADMAFQDQLNASIFWNSLIFVIWFVFAGIYVTKLFTTPISSIAKTSLELAQGNLSVRYLKRSRIREIEELRRSMNYLAERLEQQDTIRKRLISDISHEIRTPLHILQNNLEAMIDGIYPIDEEQMKVLYEEVVRFGKLLNNLNMLRTLEDKDQPQNAEEISLNATIKNVYNSFKITAQEKNITYSINLSMTRDVTIYSDVNAIKQIWINLLSNAFKFTPENGEIEVYTYIKNRYATVVIKDNGIGISEKDLPFVFDRMYREDKSREKYEGSGLGLTIVQNLVKKNEGKVTIESTEGEGTWVRVALPIYSHKIAPNISYRVKSYMKKSDKI